MKRASEVLVVLGTRGSGKSYWTKRWIETRPPAEPVLIWDPTAEWAGPAADRGLSGCNVFHATRDAAAALARAPMPRVVLQCGAEAAADFEQLCRLAGRGGDCTLVVDEAHAWCAQGRCPRYLLLLLRLSRHVRVNLVFIAQRPHTLAVDLREQASRIVLFNLRGESALAWVRGELGPPELADRVAQLEPREWIEWPSYATNVTRWRVKPSGKRAENAR